MKAVVWTDAIQGIIYLGGVITVLTLVSKSNIMNKIAKDTKMTFNLIVHYFVYLFTFNRELLKLVESQKSST